MAGARGHLGYVLGHPLLPLLLQLQLMLVHGRDVVLPQLLLMLLKGMGVGMWLWAGVELLLPLLLGTALHWSLLHGFTALVRHDRRHPC